MWDPFIRIFHWALVVGFVLAYVVIEPATVHGLVGTTIGALIAARIVWGLVGPRHGRFADFVYSPVTVFRYMRDLLRFRQHARYIGHSPGGGYVILSMLALLVATTCTGLVGWFADGAAVLVWHGFLANATLAMVGVHIVGVLLRSFVYRQNLVLAQFTGYKRH